MMAEQTIDSIMYLGSDTRSSAPAVRSRRSAQDGGAVSRRFFIGFALMIFSVWALTWMRVYNIGQLERAEAIATTRNTSRMVSAYVSQTAKAGRIVLDSMRSLISDHGIETEEQFKSFLDDVEVHKMMKNRIIHMSEIDKAAFISNTGEILRVRTRSFRVFA